MRCSCVMIGQTIGLLISDWSGQISLILLFGSFTTFWPCTIWSFLDLSVVFKLCSEEACTSSLIHVMSSACICVC